MKYWKVISKIIWSNLFCQKHSPDKMAQHLVSLHLKIVPFQSTQE